MVEKAMRRLKTAATTALLGLTGFVGTAAASHDGLDCTVPGGLEPLLSFMHTLETIALLGGVSVGTIGFLVAGIYIMMPGEDPTRKGKSIAKHVLLGAVLLFSAQMIMGFLISQLGTTICTGG
jgi:hypothetical protein